MNALHLVTEDAIDSEDASLVEMAVKSVDGVAAVASIRSLGLTSVLYDEQRAHGSTIVDAVRAAGFEPRVCWRDPTGALHHRERRARSASDDAA